MTAAATRDAQTALSVLAFVRRWWFLAAALVGLGTVIGHLDAENKAQWQAIELRAPTDSVRQIRRDVTEILNRINEMNTRQTQFFCRGQPSFCR